MKNGITHAPTLLKESFLSNYFFADVMFSRFLATDGARIIFDRYADISGVKDEKWLNTMWDIISSDLFAKADTSSNFNTLLRLSCLFPDRFSENEQYILSLKSSAMQIKETILPSGDNITLDTTKSTIESKAQGGDTDCLALLAFLKYHGFFFAKDQESALKHIKTGACWNHFFCLLMGAQYDPNPHFYHEVIVAILSAPSQLETLNYLREGLNISADTKPYKPSVELEKAFHRGAFQRYKLCPDILKMISSSVLTEQTKCSIIKSANGKDMAHPDIPLNISKASELSYDLSKFRLFSESRSSECDKIIANLSVSDIRASSVYKPLLIVCQDKAAFDLYHIAISDCFKDSPFTILNFAAISDPSFAPCKDNIFISVLDKLQDKNAVVLLEHCEELSEENSASLSKFLSGSFRQNYKLNGSTQISLDLSGVLPIILTSSIPSKEICSKCDVVTASKMYPEEFIGLFEKVIEAKKDTFRLKALSVEKDALSLLARYEYETASILLDKAIGRLRADTSDVNVTSDEIRTIADIYCTKKESYSFWGGYHNDK